ncbi:adipocyte plasma membrane-associated protein Hemomucin [Drosophila bipectinata]|uniref:adipocyte plasma membrane-associated protein Hemomucin n=1 Tax=Drosophila bipectinata TaxID=42026 RepID=UPI001C88E704|nr:adipocyte plasma membrane-associated protein [Drosophila bipectinata]
MGFVQSFLKKIVYSVIILGAIYFLPGLPPKTTFPFKEYVIKPPRELTGVLQLNSHLDGARHLFKDQVFGPENLLPGNDGLYTGIYGGEVLKLNIEDKRLEAVTKVGKPCDYIYDLEVCGYPVGLALDTKGNNLIVGDAYYGLWEVNLETKKRTQLVSPEDILPGTRVHRPARLFNSVAVSQNGDIYWTDSLSDDVSLVLFANPSGRLFRYNREQKTNEVLLDGLAFANGLALSPNEDFVVVVETAAMRLLKYYLKGPRAGQTEVFVDGLPGLPDNLTPDSEGIWVPLGMSVDTENPNIFAKLSPYPNLRFFLSRMVALIQLPFRLFNSIFPNNLSVHLFHSATSWFSSLSPNRTTVLRVDWNGNIVKAFHGFDRSAAGISHAVEYKGHLYLGSPFNPYIIQVKLPETDEEPKNKQV